jgi:hypothetical protein
MHALKPYRRAFSVERITSRSVLKIASANCHETM